MLRMSPVELVAYGYCDPVRLFVKQEPHPVKKLAEGRFRLISSVSLVDQLVERMLFGPQNQLEIVEWRSIPSKPGMGLSVAEQAQSIFHEVRFKHNRSPACEADISGFDWSVQDWELWADVEMRISLSKGICDETANAMRTRFYCFMNSVFQLSNGTLIEQGLPGLMKSGSYCTSSTNSRVRCLMASLIGADWCIAMGDDSVEAYIQDARAKYGALGHTCKDYVPCSVGPDGTLESFNFCSHFIAEREFHLTSWPKTLFRFLCDGESSYDELHAELHSCPAWPRIVAYLRLVGKLPDKTYCGKPSRTHGDPAKQEATGDFNSCDSQRERLQQPLNFTEEAAAAQAKQGFRQPHEHRDGASCYECYSAASAAAAFWWGR